MQVKLEIDAVNPGLSEPEGFSQLYSDRACTPQDTFRRVEPLLKDFGITRLARVTGLDRIGIPVWNAIAPNSRTIVIQQGKGIRDIDAKVSATMEALERAIAEEPQLESRRYSQSFLKAHRVPFEPMEGLIAAGESPASEVTGLDWVEGLDLLTLTPVLVPLEAVTLDGSGSSRYWRSSDGLASGNIEAEAMFHGTLERIERDAMVLWQLKSPTARLADGLDPASFHDPVINHLMAQVKAAGFCLRLFNATGDLEIPVIHALLAPMRGPERTRLRYVDFTMGSGAHPLAARAAIRAITEAAQSRLTLISGARDDVPPEIYEAEPHPLLLQMIDAPARPFGGQNLTPPGVGLAQMLEAVLERLARLRLGPVIAVRLNPAETRIAVVKILAPKLENPEGSRRLRFGGRAVMRMMAQR